MITGAFDSIENPYPLPLLILGSKETEYFKDILDWICKLCCESIWNCFSCYKSDILLQFLNLLETNLDKEIVKKILELFTSVNLQVSSRQLLFGFCRLFHVLESENVSTNIQEYINCFISLFKKRSNSPQAFIHFASSNEFIECKFLQPKEISNNFTLTFWFLIDNFQHFLDAFSIINIFNDKSYFHIYLTNQKFCVNYLDSDLKPFDTSIPLNFPILTWFNLSIYFDLHENLIKVFINGEQSATINISLTCFNTRFDTMCIQNQPSKSNNEHHWVKHGQLSYFAILLGTFTTTLSQQIYNYGYDGFYPLLSNPSLHSLFSAQKANQGYLINYTNESLLMPKFKGSLSTFVASFLQILEATNGVEFLTTLWSQIGYTYPNSTEIPNLSLFLASLFESLVGESELAQLQMIQSKTYSVISYFLINAAPKTELTKVLWNKFYSQFAIMNNEDLKRILCNEILFNIDIWIKANYKSTTQIFKQYRYFIETNKKEYWEKIDIPLIMGILDYYSSIMENNFNEENEEEMTKIITLVNVVLELLSFIFKLGCSPEHLELILMYCITTKLSTIISPILRLLKSCLNDNQLIPLESIKLITKYSTAIYFNLNNQSKIEMISLILEISGSIARRLKILLNFIYSIHSGINDENDESLIILLNVLMNSSIGKFDDKSPNEENYKIQNFVNFYVCFFAALKINNETQKVFTDFIYKVINDQNNHQILTKNLNQCFLFLIILYYVIANNSINDFIAKILPIKIKIFQCALQYFHVIEKVYDTSLYNLIDKLIISLIPIFSKKQNVIKRYLEVIINYLLIRPKFKTQKFDFKSFNQTKITFIDIYNYILNYNETEESYEYGLLIENNQWAEEKIFQLLLQLIFEQQSKNETNIITEQYLTIFLYYYTNYKFNIKTSYQILLKVINRFPNINYKPIILNFSLNPNKNELINIFPNENLKIPNLEYFIETTELLNQFYSTIPKPIVIDQTTKDFILSFNLNFFNNVQKFSQFNKINLSFGNNNDWYSLCQKLRNEQSPFFKVFLSSERKYKASTFFDYRFRPILLTPKYNLNNFPEFKENKQQKNENNSKNTKKKFLKSNKPKGLECIKITIKNRKEGIFKILNKGYNFINNQGKELFIKSDSVLYIFYRWELLRPNSIEIFLNNHHSYFFSFPGKDHKYIISQLTKIPLPNKIFIQTKSSDEEFRQLKFTERWLDHSMSTFDYLIALNMFSGRSFNNMSCYPIFPWVLKDYEEEPNLTEGLRDFKLPIGAMNPNYLESCKRKMQQSQEIGAKKLFLYSSCYSNLQAVTYYLIRLEPFTQQHIRFHDGKFDNPNRQFFSIIESQKILFNSNQSNCRELTPEFFFFSDFLCNNDKVNFGILANGLYVDDVIIPKWATSHYDFIQKHIRILESEECGKEISNWIDLIWGYKQSGEEAKKSNNLFDPAMYINYNIGPDEIDETETVRKACGQIPIQIFSNPHPQRHSLSQKQTPLIPTNIGKYEYPVLNLFMQIDLNNISDSLKIYSVHRNGNVICTKTKNIRIISQNIYFPLDSRYVSYLEKYFSFVFISNDGNSITFCSLDKKKIIKCNQRPHIAAVSCISTSKDFIVTGGCDASVVLWKIKNYNAVVLRQSVVHNDTISCVTIDDNFGIVVSCSRDGKMTIYQLPTLSFIRSIDLNLENNCVPKSVVISKCMGNICVICYNESNTIQENKKTFVRLYTINGKLINEVTFFKTITDIYAVYDSNCFDYFFFLDQNEILLVDGYTLDKTKTIYQGNEKIAAIYYHQESEILVVGYEKGEFSLVFYPLDAVGDMN